MTTTPSPLFDQALKQHRAGDLTGAAELYQTLLQLYPDHAQVLRHWGLAELQRGRLSDAEPLLERAQRLLPSSADVLSDLGSLRSRQDRPAEAESMWQAALQLDPDHTDVLENYTTLLLAQHRAADAAGLLERLVILAPESAAALRLLADAHYDLDKTHTAIELYQQAIELDPNDRRARLRLGEAYESRGQFKRARLQYMAIVRRGASSPLALARLLLLRDGDTDPQWIADAEALCKQAATPPEPRIRLQVALAHAYDRRGQYAQAFDYLRAGNEAAFERRPFDSDGFSEAIDALLRCFDARYFDGLAQQARHPSAKPILVVGMPRSGTTLTEQILASHPQVAAGGELATVLTLVARVEGLSRSGQPYPFGFAGLGDADRRALAEYYLERLQRVAPDARRVTDKLPFNFMHLGLVAALLPNATMIHVERDPLDTVLSCYFTSFADEIRFASTLPTLARYYRDYRRLMQHWERVLPSRLLTVRYESLVSDTELEVRRLLEHCGLPWEEACLEAHRTPRDVRTPSTWQVRQPIYATSIGRWRHYEQQLEPVRALLAAD